MRVIGGEYRRRRLIRPGRSQAHLRPTYDSVRENVFNLIGERVPDARFLDLFAGTGCVGIEALSRGAAECIFVDSSAESLSLIRDNCTRLSVDTARYHIFPADVPEFLRSGRGGGFDIIFLDPPYDTGLFDKTMEILGEHSGLAEGCVVVGQHGRTAAEERFGGLIRADQRKYGGTWISLWERT